MQKKRLTGFVLYESYVEALNELSGDDFKEMVNAIMRFVIDDVEPKLEKPMMRIIFKSLKPNIEANKIKYLKKKGYYDDDEDTCKNVVRLKMEDEEE